MTQERNLKERQLKYYESEVKHTPLHYASLPRGGTIKREIAYKEIYTYESPLDDISPFESQPQEIGKIFEEQLKTSARLSLDDLTNDHLLSLFEKEETATTKSGALEILLARNCENCILAAVVYRELVKGRLPISWRNTLLLALEHIQIEDPKLRRELSNFLLQLCPNMKDETYPRSRSALAAALRTLPTLLDDVNQTVQLLMFLNTEYPTQIRRIVLLGIQSIARFPTPGNIPEEAVTIIGDELVCCARYLLRNSVYPTSEEEFDLGLDVIDTLIILAYNDIPSLICELESLRVKWVVEQLNDTLLDTIKMWETCAPSFYNTKKDLIASTRKTLNSIHAS